jgi:molybdenum-dependent DNA-binding transcriptional regulator ModE
MLHLLERRNAISRTQIISYGARMGSITHAAKKFGLSQPMVTTQVRTLEA